jgi:hypothetical protein
MTSRKRAKKPTFDDAVFMSITVPAGMTEAQAVERARVLLPCQTETWEKVDEGNGWVVGNMYCETGYYDDHPDGAEYGPDDAGVKVEWETP